jgi:hypothetical protein
MAPFMTLAVAACGSVGLFATEYTASPTQGTWASYASGATIRLRLESLSGSNATFTIEKVSGNFQKGGVIRMHRGGINGDNDQTKSYNGGVTSVSITVNLTHTTGTVGYYAVVESEPARFSAGPVNITAKAAAPATYSFSGKVASGLNGPGLSGATVTFDGRSTTTDAGGAFTITGLTTGNKSLSISKSGYQTYTNNAYYLGGNLTGQGFYLTPNAVQATTYSFSGKVSNGQNGPGLSGATVTLDGKTATTDAGGAFTITGLTTGNKNLSISKSGYQTYSNGAYYVSGNMTGQGFFLAAPPAPTPTPAASNLQQWQKDVVARAEDYVKNYSSKSLVSVFGNSCGSYTYCYAFARNMHSPAYPGGIGTAYQAFKRLVSEGKAVADTNWDNAPVGALVFFLEPRAASNAVWASGHAAIKADKDSMIGQGNPPSYNCTITKVSHTAYNGYLGYAAPSQGSTGFDPNIIPASQRVSRSEFLQNLVGAAPSLEVNIPWQSRAQQMGLIQGTLTNPGDPVIRQDAGLWVYRFLNNLVANNRLVIPVIGDANRFQYDTAITGNSNGEVRLMAPALAKWGIIAGLSMEGGGYSFEATRQLSASEASIIVSQRVAPLVATLPRATVSVPTSAAIRITRFAPPTSVKQLDTWSWDLATDQPAQSVSVNISDGGDFALNPSPDRRTWTFSKSMQTPGARTITVKATGADGRFATSTLSLTVVSTVPVSKAKFTPDPTGKWKSWQSAGTATVTTAQLRDGNVYKLTPAQIIYYSCIENHINPVLMLAKLNHEAVLIEKAYDDSLLQHMLDRATGYDYKDSGTPSKYPGFYPQLVGGTFQFNLWKSTYKSGPDAIAHYSTDKTACDQVASHYEEYSKEMNRIAGTNFASRPTGWGYTDDFKNITAAHIQTFLNAHPTRLKDVSLFTGSAQTN